MKSDFSADMSFLLRGGFVGEGENFVLILFLRLEGGIWRKAGGVTANGGGGGAGGKAGGLAWKEERRRRR